MYEEKSLGIYEPGPDEDDEYAQPWEGPRAHVWGKYLMMHARRQLSFGMSLPLSLLWPGFDWFGWIDIWWLGFALWLVCIIEVGFVCPGPGELLNGG